jgi:hypothetical protein
MLTDVRWRTAATAAVLGALLVAPAVWSAQTLGHATDGTFPAGGPAAAGFGPGGGIFGGADSAVASVPRRVVFGGRHSLRLPGPSVVIRMRALDGRAM